MIQLAAWWLVYQGICYGLAPERQTLIHGVSMFPTAPPGVCVAQNPPHNGLVIALFSDNLFWLRDIGVTELYGPATPHPDGVRRLLCTTDRLTGRIDSCTELGKPFTVNAERNGLTIAVCPDSLLPENIAPSNTSLDDYIWMRSNTGISVPILPLWVRCWYNCGQVNNAICTAWPTASEREPRRSLRR